MSGRFKTGLFLTTVVLLTFIPLLVIKAPMTGSDSQAAGVIHRIAPDYQPWFQSLFKPPGAEIENLLFALQAALGAGVIGYYLGYMHGKKKTELPPPNEDHRAH